MKLCLALIPFATLSLVSCGPCKDPQGAYSMDGKRMIDVSGRVYRCVFGDPNASYQPAPSAKQQAEIEVVGTEQ